MTYRAARIPTLGLVAIALLSAGCGGSSGHQTGTATIPTSRPASQPTATTAETPKAVGAPAAAERAGLASLKQQLDAAGSSLTGAADALAQSDPDRTKNAEGSAP